MALWYDYLRVETMVNESCDPSDASGLNYDADLKNTRKKRILAKSEEIIVSHSISNSDWSLWRMWSERAIVWKISDMWCRVG